jgi:hypothetical protein
MLSASDAGGLGLTAKLKKLLNPKLGAYQTLSCTWKRQRDSQLILPNVLSDLESSKNQTWFRAYLFSYQQIGVFGII